MCVRRVGRCWRGWPALMQVGAETACATTTSTCEKRACDEMLMTTTRMTTTKKNDMPTELPCCVVE